MKWILLIFLFVLSNEEETEGNEIDAPAEQCDAFSTLLHGADSRLKAMQQQMEQKSNIGFQRAEPSNIVERGQTKTHDIEFTSVDIISRRSAKLTEDKRSVQLSSKQRKKLSHFFVTMDGEKNIQLWNEQQELMHEIRSGLKGKVTARATLNMPNNQFYMIGSDQGEVKLFEIKSWRPIRNGKLYDLIDARIELVYDLVVPKKAFGPHYLEASANEKSEDSGESETQTEAENDPSFTYPGVRFLGIYRKKSNRKFLVVFSNDQIHLWDKLGKWRKRYESDDEITGFTVGPATTSVLVTKSGFTLFRTIKMKTLSAFCDQEGTITSATFDVKFNHMLYLAKENGTVVVHNTKKLGGKKKRHCRTARRYDFNSGTPVSISSVEGYFFTVLPRSVLLHNVSGLIWTARGLEYMQDLDEGSLVSVGSFESRKSHMFVVVNGRNMTTYNTFLPGMEDQNGGMFKNFSRIPMVFGVMVFFLGYQYFSGGSNPLQALTGRRKRKGKNGPNIRLGFNQMGRRTGRVADRGGDGGPNARRRRKTRTPTFSNFGRRR